jgi:hypothetical protein
VTGERRLAPIMFTDTVGFSALAAIGRFEEASRRSTGEGPRPLSAPIVASVGAVYLVARRYEVALLAIRKAIADYPQFRTNHLYRRVLRRPPRDARVQPDPSEDRVPGLTPSATHPTDPAS